VGAGANSDALAPEKDDRWEAVVTVVEAIQSAIKGRPKWVSRSSIQSEVSRYFLLFELVQKSVHCPERPDHVKRTVDDQNATDALHCQSPE